MENLSNKQIICEFCKNIKTINDSPSHVKRRKFCSQKCSNSANGIKKSSGMTRVEYEKEYWSKPENKSRQKISKEKARLKRMVLLGDSYIKGILGKAKRRSIIKNIEFSIDSSDITIPEYCPILGFKLEFVKGRGGNFNSPSLDRIDNNKGYIKGNVQIISKRANMIKSDATLDEIYKVFIYMKNFSSNLTIQDLQAGKKVT